MFSDYSIKRAHIFEIIPKAGTVDSLFHKVQAGSLSHVIKLLVRVTFTNPIRAGGQHSAFHISAPVFRFFLPTEALTLSWRSADLPLPIILLLFKFHLSPFLLLLLSWLEESQNNPVELEMLIQTQRECYSGDGWQRGGP